MFTHRANRRAGLRAGAVITTLGLVLAACGGGSDDGGSGDSGVATYTVASLLDFSGPFANRGKPVEGMQRAVVDWFNETQGKELGVRLSFKPYDTGYDVAKSLSAFQQALNDDDLIGTLQFGSPIVAATIAKSAQSKIPGIQGGPRTDGMKAGAWVESPLGDYGSYFAAAIQSRLKDRSEGGKLRVSFVSFDGISAQGWSKSMKEKLKGVNAEVVNEEYIAPTSTDVSVNISRVLKSNPDAVIVATTDTLQPLVLDGLHKRGFDMSKVTMSQHEGIGLMQNLKVSDEVLEGVQEVTTQRYQDEGTEAYKIFKKYSAKYDTRWAADTVLHFPSTTVLVDAVGRAAKKYGADKLTGEKVYAEMANGSFDGYGLMSEISFEDSVGSPDSTYILELKDGKIEQKDELPLP
jgi:branched-chain amino acid transport system substrate-binding protein